MRTLWRVFHDGEWRPVTHMFRGQQPVRHPERANVVVIFVDGEYIPLQISQGEIFTEWLPELPPAGAWMPVA